MTRVKRALLVVALSACGPGSRCPTAYGEIVAARPLRCDDLAADAKRFDGQVIDVRGRLEHHPNGPRVRLLEPGASGDCGRLAGSGVILRLHVERKVVRDCTSSLDRRFARIVGTLSATPDAAGTTGEITPVAIVPEQ